MNLIKICVYIHKIFKVVLFKQEIYKIFANEYLNTNAPLKKYFFIVINIY